MLLDALYERDDVEVILFSDTKLNSLFGPSINRFEVVQIKNRLIRRLWRPLLLPLALIVKRAGVFFSSWDKGLPYWSLCPCVYMINDLFSLDDDADSTKKRHRMFLTFKKEIQTASKILAISEFTKQDIVRRFGVLPEQIEVIKLDCDRPRIDKALCAGVDIFDTFSQLRRREYFISVSGRISDKRKNVFNLIKAYEKYRNSGKIFCKKKLVIVGGYSPAEDNAASLMRYIEEKGLSSDIIFAGYLEDDMLYPLLAGAYASIFVTKLEGFGIPVLEAFYLGVPLIAADNSATAEVAGSGALPVDAEDVDAIALSMRNIVEKHELASELIKKAEERLNDYLWQNSVDRIVKIFKDI